MALTTRTGFRLGSRSRRDLLDSEGDDVLMGAGRDSRPVGTRHRFVTGKGWGSDNPETQTAVNAASRVASNYILKLPKSRNVRASGLGMRNNAMTLG